MIAVQVLCGISAIGLRSPENADLTTIAARSFNTLAKWLKRNPQLMDPDVVSSTQDSVTTLTQILAFQPVSEAVENEGKWVPTYLLTYSISFIYVNMT